MCTPLDKIKRINFNKWMEKENKVMGNNFQEKPYMHTRIKIKDFSKI